VRQLPLSRLALSPALSSADPAAMARRAGADREAAQELGKHAGQLTALGERLRAGPWVSPASARFVEAAAEQARRVRVAAGLLQQLAAGLAELSAELDRARAEALAAVAGSRQLDALVEQFNHRVRGQHALLPQDPDSLLLPDQEGADLTARMQLAASELANAESRARRAWLHGQVAFDLVGQATPVMRQRMVSGSWDPAASVGLAAGALAATVTTCGPMDELGLPANGVLTGPDGRAYHLVVQTARDRDGRLLVSTQEQPADRLGWYQLAVRLGTTAYGRKASTWEKVAVGLGGAAGASYPEGSTFAPSLLGELHIMPGGGAYVPELPPDPGDPVKEAPAEPPRGKGAGRYWIAPRSGLAGGRRAATPDAIGLLDGAVSGFLLATRLDSARAADYRVVFEENAQGQRRARMQLFRVVTGPDAPPSTVAAGGYVDASGHLAGIPVTGEAPDRRPIITEPGH
jgi:hypothetical protein